MKPQIDTDTHEIRNDKPIWISLCQKTLELICVNLWLKILTKLFYVAA